MASIFEFQGGVKKPTNHTIEKFMMFFVMNGSEVPFYVMKQNSLLVKVEGDSQKYQSSNNIIKLFVSRQGFGVARQFYSFYLRLDDSYPEVTILPFSLQETGFFFKAQGSFLSNKEAAGLIDKDGPSYSFVMKQGILPLDTLRSMVRIDRAIQKKGIRQVRFGKNRITKEDIL